MKLFERNLPTSHPLDPSDPLTSDLGIFEPEMGRGSCKICGCAAYNSDSTNSGRCICSHVAADHN